MQPFDLQIALKHPERVRHADGKKAIRVVHIPEAGEDFRVAIVWAGCSRVVTYTETGRVYVNHPEPVLFLTPETKLVPWSSPDEVPDGCWFRGKTRPGCEMRSGCVVLFTEASETEIKLLGVWRSLAWLFQHCEYSLFRSGPWLPCGKEVQNEAV